MKAARQSGRPGSASMETLRRDTTPPLHAAHLRQNRRPMEEGNPMIRKTLVGLWALIACLPAWAADAQVVEARQPVAGASQAQWTRAWWQWATSFTREASPVADTTGERCAAGQNGPVWFLAGTYGTRRTIRTCTVPADKYLFFPLINFITKSTGEIPMRCEDVAEVSRDAMDDVTSLVLRIDGRAVQGLQAQRIGSEGCFDAGLRQTPPARIYPSAADGFYVMLKPLGRGRHTVEFGGITPDMAQAVSYTLDVR